MPLLVCWLFADSSQCKGMQTAGRQVVHAPCVSGGGASVWPKTGRAARGVASSVVCQSCSDIAVEGGKRETTVRWRGLLAWDSAPWSKTHKPTNRATSKASKKRKKVRRVNRSFRMWLKNNDKANRVEQEMGWRKDRNSCSRHTYRFKMLRVAWEALCTVEKDPEQPSPFKLLLFGHSLAEPVICRLSPDQRISNDLTTIPLTHLCLCSAVDRTRRCMFWNVMLWHVRWCCPRQPAPCWWSSKTIWTDAFPSLLDGKKDNVENDKVM